MLLVVSLGIFLLRMINGDKIRAWMGPSNFLGGPLPIARQGHGLVSFNDTKLVLFAGTNAFFGKDLDSARNKRMINLYEEIMFQKSLYSKTDPLSVSISTNTQRNPRLFRGPALKVKMAWIEI